jgi:putative addiction module component (TIGR02574 family)
MNKALRDQVMQLPVEERVKLADDIWESIPVSVDDFELTPEQRQEIERRMAEHERDPSSALTLEQFEARLRARSG